MPQLPAIFAALSDATRFAIVERLLDRGEQSAGDLADVAEISAPAISRHLKVLREAGIVTQRIHGPRRIYAVAPEPLRAISAWVIGHREFWQGSLDRLETALGNRSKE